jgi:hypothetical protein
VDSLFTTPNIGYRAISNPRTFGTNPAKIVPTKTEVHKMVRPKASHENLAVALAFANIVIARDSTENINGTIRVHRKGPRSLYAVFRACLPALARRSDEPNPIDRSAVTCIEFNKIMHSSGFQSFRKRECTPQGVKWTLKVIVGASFERCNASVTTSFLFQYWENCRWVDPDDDRELEKMAMDLQRARAKYAKLRGCNIERLCEVLSATRDSQQTDISDVDGYSIPMSHHDDNQLFMKRASPLLPGSMETNIQRIVHGGHELLVQVLHLYSGF